MIRLLLHRLRIHRLKIALKLAGVALVLAVTCVASSRAFAMTYDELPCPTEAQFASLLEEFQFDELPLTGSICGSSDRSKLAKLFFFISTLEVEKISDDWALGAAEALRSPSRFLKKSVHEFTFDLDQPFTIASNIFHGIVLLGGALFELPPLEALLTLVHEARHSAREAVGHVRCVRGDIPYAADGCDEKFSASQNAGSYAYEVSFALGLAKFAVGLSSADRQSLQQYAVDQLSLRINQPSTAIAEEVDVIYLLDDAGKLYSLQLFSKKLIQIDTHLKVSQKIAKIEFDHRNNGVRLITEDSQVFSIKPNQGTGSMSMPWFHQQDFTGSIDPDARTVLSAHPLNDQNDTFNCWVSSLRRLYCLEPDVDTGKMRPVSVLDSMLYFELSRLATSGPGLNYLVDTRGRVYDFDFGAKAITESKFQAPDGHGWRQVVTGANYDRLYGVSKSGILFRQETNHPPRQDAFQAGFGQQAFAYAEGQTVRVLLATNGSLVIEEKKPMPRIQRVTFGEYGEAPHHFVGVAVVSQFRLNSELRLVR